MKVTLIRHGETPGNAMLRYIGRTDEPLSPVGCRQAAGAAPDLLPSKVFVSSLRRTSETAGLLFPGVPQTTVPGLDEMDFGSFEGQAFTDMESDPLYRLWVDGGCEGQCPGGESREDFINRVLNAFEEIIRHEIASESKEAVFVVHGGTIMAIMSRCAVPARDYFAWSVKNCQGYECEASLSPAGRLFLADVVKWGEA